MMPAPFIASAETYPRRIRSMSTGETPVLMTWAPMPQIDARAAAARRHDRIDHAADVLRAQNRRQRVEPFLEGRARRDGPREILDPRLAPPAVERIGPHVGQIEFFVRKRQRSVGRRLRYTISIASP